MRTKRNNMKRWFVYIIGLVLLGACTDEEYIPTPGPGDGSAAEELTLTLRFPQSSDISTKALGNNAEENRVTVLDVLFFEKASSGNYLNDKLVYRYQFTGSTTPAITGSNDIKTVTPVKVRNMDKDQRIILLANLPSGTLTAADTANLESNTKTLNEIVQKLKFNASAWQKDGLSGTTDPAFPMWGQMASVDYVKFHHTNTTSKDTTININMIRAVARIDIGVNIGGINDPALGFGDIFKIQKVYLCNTNQNGYINPHNEYLSLTDSVGRTVIYKPNPDNTAKVSFVEYDFKVTESSDSIMARTIYTTESDITANTSAPLPLSGNKAFLVVDATYYGTQTFYRIDFAKDGEYVPLLRNNRYEINIVGARRSGFGSLQEAIDSAPVLVNPALIFEVTETELNGIITNEQYMLAYEADEIKIDWDGQINFKVKTDYPGGVKTSAGTVNGTAGNVQSVQSTLTPNTTNQPVPHTVTISAGTLKKDIKVIQSTGSNSYIVTGSTAQIPAASANVGGVGRITGSFTTEVLWSDGVTIANITNGSGSSDIINISGISGSGNAVIVAKSGSNILYSWHLWVTPDPTATLRSNNGFIFMDRNLGATTSNGTGLYYQWGRKDPFVGSVTASMIDTVKSPMTNNLELSIRNPNRFYASISSPYDWLTPSQFSQDNNYWNTINGEKGSYDPCPFGWRVPPVGSDNTSPWKDFTGNTRNGIIFPLAGYIDMFSGQLLYLSTDYHVWGASARNSAAYLFKGAEGQAFRANAYPIRCVKDIKQP